MSIFEDLNTNQQVRKQLFYLVCIFIRFLIATVFVLATLLLDSWASYLVGSIEIVGGLGFWYKWYKTDVNEQNLWWYRGWHGLFWVSGGIATIVLRHEQDANSAAAATGGFLFFDVVFGILTSIWGEPGWKLTIGMSRAKSYWFAMNDYPGLMAVFTPWTIVHVILTSAMGVAAYYIWPSQPWVGCIGLSFIVFLWEAAENTFPKKVKVIMCNNEADREADSWVNQLSDTIVGLVCLWSVAYVLHAA